MAQATAVDAAEKLDFKRILPIFVIVLVDLLGLTIIIPLLPLYATAFGADAFTVGLMQAAYPLMQLVGGPLLGSLSDRYGRKPVLIASQIGTFAGFILLGFANALPLVFLSRIIDGLTGGNIVVAQAAITDSTTEKTRTQGLGLIGAAFGLGFTLGPAIAGIALVATDNDYHVPAFLAAGFSLVSILLTTFWYHETLPAERRGQKGEARPTGNVIGSIGRALRNPLIGGLLVLMFMQQFVFGGFESLLALFSLARLGMNASGNALLFLFVGVILVLVQGKFIGPWSRRYGERRLIYAGLGLLAAGLLVTAVTPPQPVPWYSRAEMLRELDQSRAAGTRALEEVRVPLPDDTNPGWLGFAWIMAAMIPTTIGAAVLSPSINSLITKRINAAHIGGTLGVSASLVSAANAVTPVIGGAVFQFMGTSAPFLLGAGLMALLLVAALRHIRPGPEEARANG